MERVSQALIPAAVTGAVAGLGAKMLFPDSVMRLPLVDRTVPTYVGYGVLAGASKVVNHLVADTIIPAISKDGSLVGVAGLASPALTGGALVAMDKLLVKSNESMIKVFALGVGADIAGEWVKDRIM